MPSVPEVVSEAAFLRRAEDALLASGARPVSGPEWSKGWDSLLLHEVPGGLEIYAIGLSSDAAELSSRIDRLTKGLVSALPAVPLHLVLVLPRGGSAGEARRLGRLGPTTYFPNVHPRTWVVDLERGEVRAPRLGRAEGFAAIQSAARGEAAPVTTPGQMHDFRLLMRDRQPLVTYALIAVNVAVFVLLSVNGGPGNGPTLVTFGALQPRLILDGEWWRLLTAIFLHASVPHILFNMTSLFAVGTLAERLYGSGRFLAIYLGAGLIGSAVSFGLAIQSGTLGDIGVGASGAIFGVAGALITARFHSSTVIPQRLRDRISTSMIPLVVISLVLAYLTPYVDNAAHIGGLLGGMLLSFAFPLTKTLPATARRWS
ncbi:MAG TPA: rhomboid family intramembrane serine protease [Chloroflexota bacterium]|nr:rhomboid family intramembrane serine protease [Chloroflexota bacterium]